ncbi:hypothetical protein, partial [uncultured Faecalibaculum sp.]|uniref:hypothetical protein n=1 Tax=uncultured Faecalibaculum sp. TaxID=1729681 RepID=UPI00261409D9
TNTLLYLQFLKIQELEKRNHAEIEKLNNKKSLIGRWASYGIQGVLAILTGMLVNAIWASLF